MNIQEINKQLYQFDSIYKPETITSKPNLKQNDSFPQKLLNIKFRVLEKYIDKNKRLLNLGCGNGIHDIMLAPRVREIVGVDFSDRFLFYAKNLKKKKKLKNVNFIKSSFEKLKLKDNSFDIIFSFASIYHYAGSIELLYSEISRVISSRGLAILEVGNSNSLNHIVCNYSSGAKNSPHTINEHLREIEKSYEIIEHRSFQLSPMWSVRPLWLLPLNNIFLTKVLSININKKMIDEWLSSIPVIRNVAFRHFFVLKKKN